MAELTTDDLHKTEGVTICPCGYQRDGCKYGVDIDRCRNWAERVRLDLAADKLRNAGIEANKADAMAFFGEDEQKQAQQGETARQELEAPHLIDLIRHPPHYKTATGIEAIDVIEGFKLDYNLGNVIKYVLRHANKGGKADLEKARSYLNRAISGSWDV